MITLPLVRWAPAPMSCYLARGKPAPLPARMARLHPEALDAIRPLTDRLVLSDCYRDVATQIAVHEIAAARGNAKGVAPFWGSGHPWGLCVDLDVAATVARFVAAGGGASVAPGSGKAVLDDVMLSIGFRCYRKDHNPTAKEAWHYTFGATEHGQCGVLNTVDRVYGLGLLGPEDVRLMLEAAGYSTGGPGWGPKCKAALADFMKAHGIPGKPTLMNADAKRGLALVTAKVAT